MKVWIVQQFFPYEGSELVSVHATESGAKAVADAKNAADDLLIGETHDVSEWDVEGASE